MVSSGHGRRNDAGRCYQSSEPEYRRYSLAVATTPGALFVDFHPDLSGRRMVPAAVCPAACPGGVGFHGLRSDGHSQAFPYRGELTPLSDRTVCNLLLPARRVVRAEAGSGTANAVLFVYGGRRRGRHHAGGPRRSTPAAGQLRSRLYAGRGGGYSTGRYVEGRMGTALDLGRRSCGRHLCGTRPGARV